MRLRKESPAAISDAQEVSLALRDDRFGSWHAATLLDQAETEHERGQAVETIVAAVAEGKGRFAFASQE